MYRYAATILAFGFGAGELLAVPLPDVVLYGNARVGGTVISSGTIRGTVGGKAFTATFRSESGVSYYVMHIPVDNSVGMQPRPGAILLDDPTSANRLISITINGAPAVETPLLLSNPGIQRLDISVLSTNCQIARDDDDSMESEATIDYNDDYLEKTILLDAAPDAGSTAKLWLYGKPYNYPGETFRPQQDYYLRVNGDSSKEVWFDVGALFSYRVDIFQWVSLDVPAAWLQAGANTFYIGEGGGSEHWSYNNLRVGVDTDNDLDRSWWYGNGVFTCGNNPSGCTGELMVYLETCSSSEAVIPTVSPYGVLIIAVLLAAAGFVVIKRRPVRV